MEGTSASDEEGARDLMGTVGSPMSVEYIWLGITSVDTDHGSGVGDVVAGRYYWNSTDACCRYLVGAHVGLGYLSRERRQLRNLMPQLNYRDRKCLVAK